MSITVGYPGPRGSHSDAAAAVLVPDAVRSVDLPSFVAVVEAAAAAEVTLGVLPIESSLVGPIAETHDLLYGAPLSIVREATLPIRHCLVGARRRQPRRGTTVSAPTRRRSTSAATCSARRDVRRVPAATTADAAREVAEPAIRARSRSRAPRPPRPTGSRCSPTTSATSPERSRASSRLRRTRRSAAARAGAPRCRSSPTTARARSSARSGRSRAATSTSCSSSRVRSRTRPGAIASTLVLDGHVYDQHVGPALARAARR